MTLMHLFLIHRYKAGAVHYLTPTEDNQLPDREDEDARHLHATSTTRSARSSSPTSTGAGRRALVQPNGEQLAELIRKPIPQAA